MVTYLNLPSTFANTIAFISAIGDKKLAFT
jgi:hypothetical protein